ncbi:MAG: hypothetical protein E4G94_04065 [ANME-2 cluster archaeon]|nr:MAG: hypothetical protein E4G94_04065 [ANME-2 cluster archaeon]
MKRNNKKMFSDMDDIFGSSTESQDDDFIFDVTIKQSHRKRSGDGSDFFVAEPQKTKYKNLSLTSLAEVVKKYR